MGAEGSVIQGGGGPTGHKLSHDGVIGGGGRCREDDSEEVFQCNKKSSERHPDRGGRQRSPAEETSVTERIAFRIRVAYILGGGGISAFFNMKSEPFLQSSISASTRTDVDFRWTTGLDKNQSVNAPDQEIIGGDREGEEKVGGERREREGRETGQQGKETVGEGELYLRPETVEKRLIL